VEGSELLGVITRRAAHEVRNALNAVAVNVEVVRSRMLRPDPDIIEIRTFAERAAKASDVAASLGIGLADLARLLASGIGSPSAPTVRTGSDGTHTVTLRLCSTDMSAISPDLGTLATKARVAIKLDGSTVIFTLRD